ncbi:MAG: dehydrogenase, partial [Planctomycetes bacterium]|nr:dehydrogenase [Planctomycetota bacterium]
LALGFFFLPSIAGGTEPDDSIRATGKEASLAAFHIREGFRIELVAAEPLVMDPVAIDWGADGGLWVAERADYPLGVDGKGKAGGRVRFLEDTDSDGRYDRSVVFLDGLNFPTGVKAWKDGGLVAAAPEVLFARDTNGDGRVDVREVLYKGFSEGNQQLRVNGLRWGLDNWIHCASGAHHGGYAKGNKVTSVRTGKTIVLGSRDFRIRPGPGLLDPQSGPSQFGRNRDDWGNWFGVQNSHPLWHYVLRDHHLRRNPYFVSPNPKNQVVTPSNPRVYTAKSPQKRFHSFEQSGRFTSACSGMVYRDELLFPRGSERHAFTCEPFHNVVQHNIIFRKGPTFAARRDPAESKVDFIASKDRWFRPVMVRTGPDGALWVVDMYRYMIEHPQWLPKNGQDELRSYFRHGEKHGRIYRVFPAESAPRAWPRLSGSAPADLVDYLEHPNGWVRDTA